MGADKDIDQVGMLDIESDDTLSDGQQESGASEVPHEDTEQQTEGQVAPKEADDEKYSKEEWARKRINRLERKHKQEQVELLQALQAQQQEFMKSVLDKLSPSQHQSEPEPDVDPETAAIIEKRLAIKIQEELQKQELAKANLQKKTEDEQRYYAFIEQEDKLRNKYEDYDDVASEIQPHLRDTMKKALVHLPPESIENFYQAWKENPEQIVKISKMPPEKQYAEMIRLDALLSAKKVYSSNGNSDSSAKILSPVKQKGSAQDVESIKETHENMLDDLINRYKRKR